MEAGAVLVSGRHREFYGLSLADLANARNLFHLHLLNHPHVIGTALGRYLIRSADPWPQTPRDAAAAASVVPKPKPARTLDDSEVRPYSWPCVLVLVRKWIDYAQVEQGQEEPGALVPKQLWLPDGRVVPVCVVLAEPVELDRAATTNLLFPRSFFGAGYPLATRVQGDLRIGTIGPLATDGRRVYALTSRHVLDAPGQSVTTFVNGDEVSIGTCAAACLTRLPMAEVYPDIGGAGSYVNLDVGLVDIDEVDRWTTVAYGIGAIGDVADSASSYPSLALIGQTVIAHGAASGALRGQIKALMFRYKAIGGAEYLTDYLIGSADKDQPLTTRPGDSGTLWCLPGRSRTSPETGEDDTLGLPRPLAIQWGGQVLHAAASGTVPYALATSVATVGRLLDLDLVRDWNATLFRYWGAVGHYGIALRAIEVLPAGELQTLFSNNRDNVTFPQEAITDKQLAGLSKRFVPLADVPDLAWKVGAGQRGPRGSNPESPNHFADMDQPSSSGETLLDICTKRERALDPAVWLEHYEDLGVDRFNQGLLPFRVWQIFDAMVAALRRRSVRTFLCAAGVLAHYVGDACQPLHISMYHDGEPGTGQGRGVHAAYEDDMVNHQVGEIFAGLESLPAPRTQHLADGSDAAWATIQLMRFAFRTIPPRDLVATYIEVLDRRPLERANRLWEVYGDATVKVMGRGVQALASMWLSAWRAAQVDGTGLSLAAIPQADIARTYVDRKFLASYTLDKIGPRLRDRTPVP